MNDDPIWMVYYCASCIVINEIWNASSGLPQILAHITNIHIHQQDPLTENPNILPENTSLWYLMMMDDWRWSIFDDDGWMKMIDMWWWWMTDDDRYVMMMDAWRWSICDDDGLLMVKDDWWWWMADNCIISLLHALR